MAMALQLYCACVVLALASLAAAAEAACDMSTFPVNESTYQVMNLKAAKASSVEACMEACCGEPSCIVWQFAAGGAARPKGSCWIGDKVAYGGVQTGWVGAAKAGTPTPPPPPPPPPTGPYNIDDAPGLGLRWEGVGAISGGGATSKLLMDYDAKTVSDILDYLFKPNFGLNLQMLKVEIGGDSDATEGAEPSHMHAKGDEDYDRGYEWWLMKEARARNPEIKLYGLPWAWPGWLDPAASPDKPAKNAFANPNITANYTLAWLLAAKRVHGLEVDYIGQWNERDAPAAYADALRQTVGQNAPWTTVLNRLPHYPGTGSAPDPQGCTQYQWNTTDGSRWVDEEGSVADGRSARCLARCVSRNYVTGCHSATFQWHLISSFYDYLPWKRCGVAVANQPWSGAYEITSPTWALAHTSQFAPIGWRYASHAAGVGLLSQGGSYVTRVSPDKTQFSIVVEKMSHENSACARGNNPGYTTADEDVVLILKGAFLKAAESSLRLWYSNLTDGNSSPQLFVRLADIPVGAGGEVKLTVHPEEMYTITTLQTGGKGNHSVPPATPFPALWNQTFDDETPPAPPRLWYDQMGAWEVQAKPGGGAGNVMRQVVPIWPDCWGYSCSGPTTYFGPAVFGSTELSMDILLENDAAVKFGLASTQATLDSAKGTFEFNKQTGKAAFKAGAWHTIGLLYGPQNKTLTLDGSVLIVSQGAAKAGEQVALSLSRYVFAQVDNFVVRNLSPALRP